MTEFQKRVYEATKTIPRGQTRSYKQLAIMVGRPRVFRAVASALARNQDTTVPCHRVILSNGKLGGYNGILGGKEKLLKMEGVL